jgi:hypothetical protein
MRAAASLTLLCICMQSGRALPEWDLASMRASLAPRDLDPEAGPSDGLGMSNELQTLIADMDWA